MKFLDRPEIPSGSTPGLLWDRRVQAYFVSNTFQEFEGVDLTRVMGAIRPNRFYRSLESYAPFCSEDFRILQEVRFNVQHTAPLFDIPGRRSEERGGRLSRVVALRVAVPQADDLGPARLDRCQSVDMDLVRDAWGTEEPASGVFYHGTVVIWLFEDGTNRSTRTPMARYSLNPRTWPQNRMGEPVYLRDAYLFSDPLADLQS